MTDYRAVPPPNNLNLYSDTRFTSSVNSTPFQSRQYPDSSLNRDYLSYRANLERGTWQSGMSDGSGGYRQLTEQEYTGELHAIFFSSWL